MTTSITFQHIKVAEGKYAAYYNCPLDGEVSQLHGFDSETTPIPCLQSSIRTADNHADNFRWLPELRDIEVRHTEKLECGNVRRLNY